MELKLTKLMIAVATKKQVYVHINLVLNESLDFITYATGYLDFKSKGFDTHIKFALKKFILTILFQ